MAKNPNKRYSNTAELLHDLEAVAAGSAPVQARKLFDLGSLANIESSGQLTCPQPTADIGGAEPLYEQPLFWAALVGWILAGILMITLIVNVTGG
jgi:eukaryotic-like serine/threonine-protein kinase